MIRLIFVLATMSFAGFVSSGPSDILQEQTPSDHWQVPSPENFVGFESCAKCHEQQLTKLKTTVHFKSFETLHRTAEATEYCRQLGLRSFKRTERCVRCHYTPEVRSNGAVKAASGISCENCHGPSRNWVVMHNLYGSKETAKEQETIEHRQMRIAQSIENGMRHPSNVFLLARACYQCHLVDDAELINNTNHTFATPDFNFVSWSQGQMRHNFYRTEGVSNPVSDLPRLRLMYVSDLIAALEASTKALGISQPNSVHHQKLVGFLNEKHEQLISVGQSTRNSLVAEALAQLAVLKSNDPQSTAVQQMLSELRSIGFRIASGEDVSGLEEVDEMLPTIESED